ncbi:MAG: Nif3-like dinuclear metal center hexameric protein [Oscillospiraceae bacterium]
MLKVKDIVREIEILAPPNLAESWDNVGLMVGDSNQSVKKIFVCLDVTSENVSQAISENADLIISHHPLIFSPMKNIIEDDVDGGIIRSLIANNISVYSAHTSFDNADGGMNDLLGEKLALEGIRHFTDDECVDAFGNPLDKFGAIGFLESPMEMADFVDFVKLSLGCRTIKYVGDPTDTIQTVAVCGGAGGGGIYNAYHAGADVYVTSDLRHHEAQLAIELGLNLIDSGHFETENLFCDFIPEFLYNKFETIKVATSTATPYFK